MRLFLSSNRAGRHSQELLQLLAGIDKVAVITNAKDYYSSEVRDRRVKENLDFFSALNIDPTEVDLRPFFYKSGAEKILDNFDYIWLAGGNVFLTRRALRYTKIDEYLIDRVRSNSVIYGGESAGAMAAGPTLKYSELETDEDSPNFIPTGYDKEVIWGGLEIVDFVPVPHYRGPGQPPDIARYIKLLDKAGIPHKEMSDSQAIIVNGDKTEFLK
jgi:dipeptidase E